MDWAELAKQRWRPANGDPTPGVVVDGPARPIVLGDSDDPDAVKGRLANMGEAAECSTERGAVGAVSRWASGSRED